MKKLLIIEIAKIFHLNAKSKNLVDMSIKIYKDVDG